MKYIICHGLGECPSQWAEVIEKLGFPVECPSLFDLGAPDPLRYGDLYAAFEKYCDSFTGKQNLCGLSLGGVLSLEYTVRHPDRVESLILIGVPYKIPAVTFAFQNLIFRLLPEQAFQSMGLTKANAISIMGSMANLDIPGMAEKIRVRTLILCGEKDSANKKSGKLLCRVINGSEFQEIEQAGHQANVDNPERLANIIKEFWEIE